MSSSTTNRVTAQDFYDYDKCPHRVYLNRFGDTAEKLPQSDFLNLLFEDALLHEQETIADLVYETPTGMTLEDRAQSTLQLMRDGVERIYQGVLLSAGESGIPDLLEKVNGNSKLGTYLYKPVDIKSGSGYKSEEKGILRSDYGTQLYHYGLLLETSQGTFPSEAEILNKRKERVLYRISEFKAPYDAAIPEIRALVTGAKSDEPASCSYCGQCQWWGHCEKVLVAADDITLLPDVGRSKKLALNAVGLKSIPEIPTFDFSRFKLKGIGPKTVESMKRAANSVLSKKLQILGKASLPDPPQRVYLDFEDDPTQDLIYLCGMWTEPAVAGINYHGMICTDNTGEEDMWVEFQKFCAAIASEDYVVFHYSAYEETKINALERKYGTSQKNALEVFRRRMIDLYPIVKRTVVLPTRSYGLKSIAKFLGLRYSAQDAGGAQSIVWFQEYQRDPQSRGVLDTLLTYNKEDCLVMKEVEGWLRSL
jgi:predicted RecB family nuclease